MDKSLPVHPVGHRILVEVKVKVEEAVTSSGIIVSVSKTEDETFDIAETGIVVALGPTAYQAVKPPHVWAEVGDEVYFERYSGRSVCLHGRHFRIMNDDDLIGVINKEYVPIEETSNEN